MYFDHIKRDRDNLYWQLQQLGFFISKVGVFLNYGELKFLFITFNSHDFTTVKSVNYWNEESLKVRGNFRM